MLRLISCYIPILPLIFNGNRFIRVYPLISWHLIMYKVEIRFLLCLATYCSRLCKNTQFDLSGYRPARKNGETASWPPLRTSLPFFLRFAVIAIIIVCFFYPIEQIGTAPMIRMKQL